MMMHQRERVEQLQRGESLPPLSNLQTKKKQRIIKEAKPEKEKCRDNCYVAVWLSNRQLISELATIPTAKEQKRR